MKRDPGARRGADIRGWPLAGAVAGALWAGAGSVGAQQIDGTERYTMEVKPQRASSAFCSVSTPSPDVQLVLSVRRNGTTAATVEAQ